ncbi:P-loop containing nucleoside triphosphate hydrolase protein [Xylariomycetidae sp. FL0641]|nr:P-loop containing nucleoside triphosphate hydrolase protein [Xylariomycetidae sp. FL0641]
MMDKYEAVHGRDISSFDLTSTHRMPTVSAAQALDELKTDPQRYLSTGIDALDRALTDGPGASQCPGGIQKGQMVEVWGPPGSGKTAFALQVATGALREGKINRTDNLVHFATPTLAHLISLLCKPTVASIPSDTSLVVVDALSGLVNHAFPKNLEPRQAAKGPGPSARRMQVLQFISSALQKLAATRDLVVLVLTQCATRMQAERGATLIPAINATAWEQGVATRLLLFRDWAFEGETVHDVHLVGIQKRDGKASAGTLGPLFAFDILSDGLIGRELDRDQHSLALTATPHVKRKLDQTDFEIADSEGEDYGWADEDDTELPGMPPQWQGSEDLLLGQAGEEDEHNGTDGRNSEAESPLRSSSPAPAEPGQEAGDGGDST